jgi:hypothetical protein
MKKMCASMLLAACLFIGQNPSVCFGQTALMVNEGARLPTGQLVQLMTDALLGDGEAAHKISGHYALKRTIWHKRSIGLKFRPKMDIPGDNTTTGAGWQIKRH